MEKFSSIQNTNWSYNTIITLINQFAMEYFWKRFSILALASKCIIKTPNVVLGNSCYNYALQLFVHLIYNYFHLFEIVDTPWSYIRSHPQFEKITSTFCKSFSLCQYMQSINVCVCSFPISVNNFSFTLNSGSDWSHSQTNVQFNYHHHTIGSRRFSLFAWLFFVVCFFFFFNWYCFYCH